MDKAIDKAMDKAMDKAIVEARRDHLPAGRSVGLKVRGSEGQWD